MSFHAIVDLALVTALLLTNAARVRRGVEFVVGHWPWKK